MEPCTCYTSRELWTVCGHYAVTPVRCPLSGTEEANPDECRRNLVERNRLRLHYGWCFPCEKYLGTLALQASSAFNLWRFKERRNLPYPINPSMVPRMVYAGQSRAGAGLFTIGDDLTTTDTLSYSLDQMLIPLMQRQKEKVPDKGKGKEKAAEDQSVGSKPFYLSSSDTSDSEDGPGSISIDFYAGEYDLHELAHEADDGAVLPYKIYHSFTRRHALREMVKITTTSLNLSNTGPLPLETFLRQQEIRRQRQLDLGRGSGSAQGGSSQSSSSQSSSSNSSSSQSSSSQSNGSNDNSSAGGAGYGGNDGNGSDSSDSRRRRRAFPGPMQNRLIARRERLLASFDWPWPELTAQPLDGGFAVDVLGTEPFPPYEDRSRVNSPSVRERRGLEPDLNIILPEGEPRFEKYVPGNTDDGEDDAGDDSVQRSHASSPFPRTRPRGADSFPLLRPAVSPTDSEMAAFAGGASPPSPALPAELRVNFRIPTSDDGHDDAGRSRASPRPLLRPSVSPTDSELAAYTGSSSPSLRSPALPMDFRVNFHIPTSDDENE